MSGSRLDFPARERLAELTQYLSSWQYEGGKRDLRLDMLRGFAALAMMADHVGGAGSWLVPITGGNRFLVSAAEAFVFISGALVGVVYGKLMLRSGAFAGMIKAIKRASKLYILTVALTLTYALTGNILGLWFQPDVSRGGVLGFVIEVVTLQRTLFLVDIVLMYACLLLVATPALWLLSRGYTPLVVVASWLVWGAWQVSPGTIDWRIEGNDVFHLAAWQAIFFTGMVLGFHRDAVERWVGRLPRRAFVAALLAVSAAAVVLYALQLTHLEALRADPTVYALGFAKENVPAGRLAAFVVMGCFSFTLLTVAWLPLRRATGWLLLPLGQNALTAYSLHLFMVAAAMKAGQVLFRGDLSPAMSTLFQIVGVVTVWLAVQLEPAIRLYFLNEVVPAIRVNLSPRERNAGQDVPMPFATA